MSEFSGFRKINFGSGDGGRSSDGFSDGEVGDGDFVEDEFVEDGFSDGVDFEDLVSDDEGDVDGGEFVGVAPVVPKRIKIDWDSVLAGASEDETGGDDESVPGVSGDSYVAGDDSVSVDEVSDVADSVGVDKVDEFSEISDGVSGVGEVSDVDEVGADSDEAGEDYDEVGGDYVLNVNRLSVGDVSPNIGTDDEFDVFTGFDGAGFDNALASGDYDGSDSGGVSEVGVDSFDNPLLDDGDDFEELVGVDGVWGDGSSGVIRDVDDPLVVRATSNRFDDSADGISDDVLVDFGDDGVSVELEGDKRNLGKFKLDSPGFSVDRVSEVGVGADGVIVGESVGDGEESGGGSGVGGGVSVGGIRGGKLSNRELEFFGNLGMSKAEFERRGGVGGLLLAGGEVSTESDKDRLKRLSRGVGGRKFLERGSKAQFSWKDREVLEFLALFRLANALQLARMFGDKEDTMLRRLRKLRDFGLVIDKKLYGARPIWFLTGVGMVVSGYDLPRVTDARLTFSMFPHQFTVNNTAANLWGGGVNVLNLEQWPVKNKVSHRGGGRFGERLVSELEIQSAFSRLRRFDTAEVFRPELLRRVDREFSEWRDSGGSSFGDSPELVPGNEWMWALLPPRQLRLAYHIPDLVVKRSRGVGGEPESIAVEVEISNKARGSYEKTLMAYKFDDRLYKKVVWVCKNRGPAVKLEQISKDIGLWQEGRIDIVPILTEDGVFKERDLWNI